MSIGMALASQADEDDDVSYQAICDHAFLLTFSD
jgi:hypothetical protein